jgi:hypothetical protein
MPPAPRVGHSLVPLPAAGREPASLILFGGRAAGDAALQLRFNPDIVNRSETFRSVYLPAIRDQLPESLARRWRKILKLTIVKDRSKINT